MERALMIEEWLRSIAVEIRTTKDRVRVFELGVIRAYLLNKQNEIFEEIEGVEE